MVFTSEVRVRFAETDALGHVNNTSFFIYIEVGRIDFLSAIGASSSIEDWRYVVAHVSCDFLAQAYLNEELIVTSVVSHIGTKSFTLSHDIIRKSSGEKVAQGKAVLIHYNFETEESEPIPDWTREKLETFRLEGEEAGGEQ
ncbi:MAG TPA: thioesterase family protein [Candidatus Angelobacter sp.]|nr:thioesterase family protein [Candidatus Angelobacter sp.]